MQDKRETENWGLKYKAEQMKNQTRHTWTEDSDESVNMDTNKQGTEEN